jgi:hypothetical protein
MLLMTLVAGKNCFRPQRRFKAKLGKLSSVVATGKQKGEAPLPENESTTAGRTIPFRKSDSARVREMTT